MHLKKILALVLAFACAFTMFAGAAFTDQADIKVKSDVVDTLVSLGVIEGFEDGSFQPNGTVTRAQMAKMIYVLRTGNSDASAYNDDKSSFTDIGSHWARGYIKYCQSLGIIAGKSNTKFCPNDKVTAQEAAKMLLVTLGYDAAKAGLTGPSWAAKTNALADENGLLEDVNTSFTAACPRQYAAQLIYNAIDAVTVAWRDDAYTKYNYNGSENKTIGEKYMGLNKTVGILNDVTKDTDKNTFSLTVNVNTTESNGKMLGTFTKVTKDYSALKYQKVKVLYKDKDNVFGVYSMTDDNTVVSNVMDNVKLDNSKLKIDGTKYTIASSSEVYVDGALQYVKTVDGSGNVTAFTSKTAEAVQVNNAARVATISEWVSKNSEGDNIGKASSVQAISNTDSSKINILKVTTYSVEKVTYVGTDYINAGGARKDDAYNYPSDIKKDDYVVISKAGNYADDKGLITKAETVEGKVTGTKGSDKVLINDTWYTADYKAGTTTVIDNWPSSNATVKLVLVNGFVQFVDTVTAGTADMVMVIETGSASGLGGNKVADVMFADGSRKTVELDSASEYGYNNTPVVLGTPKLATYEVSKGKYTLKKVSGTVRNGYDIYATAANATVDGNVAGASVTDKSSTNTQKLFFKSDAVVFVKYKTDDYKVVTGKDVANWNSTALTSVEALGELTSGNAYAQVAVITMTSKIPGSSDSTYAYALDDPYEQTIDGTKYTFIKAWNGTEEVTFKSEDLNTGITKRTAFEYSTNSDGTVDLTKLVGKTSATAYYAKTQITSYDEGTGSITFLDTNADKSRKNKIKAGETTILYVNSDDKVGVGAFDIEVAEDVNADGHKEDNVIVYSESTEDYINLIVVDVNNEMKS